MPEHDPYLTTPDMRTVLTRFAAHRVGRQSCLEILRNAQGAFAETEMEAQRLKAVCELLEGSGPVSPEQMGVGWTTPFLNITQRNPSPLSMEQKIALQEAARHWESDISPMIAGCRLTPLVRQYLAGAVCGGLNAAAGKARHDPASWDRTVTAATQLMERLHECNASAQSTELKDRVLELLPHGPNDPSPKLLPALMTFADQFAVRPSAMSQSLTGRMPPGASNAADAIKQLAEIQPMESNVAGMLRDFINKDVLCHLQAAGVRHR